MPLVPPGIQGRVSQHRNTNEFQPIQNTPGHITPPAAPAGLPAPVEMIAKLVDFIPLYGHNGIVWGRPCYTWRSPRIYRPDRFSGGCRNRPGHTGGGIYESHRRLQIPFAKNPEFNGINRADRRAFAAQRTRVFIPDNLPG